MTMTIDEVREHIALLEERLRIERRKVEAGRYSGPRAANLRLIEGLEGRIKELTVQCDAAAPVTAVA